jgi:hypothetical protein
VSTHRYLLLVSHLLLQILDDCRLEVLGSVDLEALHLALDFRRNVVEFLLASLNFRLPLRVDIN